MYPCNILQFYFKIKYSVKDVIFVEAVSGKIQEEVELYTS